MEYTTDAFKVQDASMGEAATQLCVRSAPVSGLIDFEMISR